jgi:hypothetical protein
MYTIPIANFGGRGVLNTDGHPTLLGDHSPARRGTRPDCDDRENYNGRPSYTTRRGWMMAMAKDVVDGDRQTISWIEVEGTDGKRWCYGKGSPAQDTGTFHIHINRNGAVIIVTGSDGLPLLRQDGAGLPRKMTVRCEASRTPAPIGPVGVAAVWSGDSGVYEYNQQ